MAEVRGIRGALLGAVLAASVFLCCVQALAPLKAYAAWDVRQYPVNVFDGTGKNWADWQTYYFNDEEVYDLNELQQYSIDIQTQAQGSFNLLKYEIYEDISQLPGIVRKLTFYYVLPGQLETNPISMFTWDTDYKTLIWQKKLSNIGLVGDFTLRPYLSGQYVVYRNWHQFGNFGQVENLPLGNFGNVVNDLPTDKPKLTLLYTTNSSGWTYANWEAAGLDQYCDFEVRTTASDTQLLATIADIIRNQIDSIDFDDGNIVQGLSTISGKLDGVTNAITSTATDVSGIESKQAVTNTKIDTTNTRLNTANTKLDTINSSLVTVKNSINTVNSSIGSMASTLDTSIDALYGQYTDSFGAINLSLSDIAGTSTTITGQLTSIAGDLSDVESGLATVNGSVSGTTTAVNTVNTSVQSLGTKIDSMSSAVTSSISSLASDLPTFGKSQWGNGTNQTRIKTTLNDSIQTKLNQKTPFKYIKQLAEMPLPEHNGVNTWYIDIPVPYANNVRFDFALMLNQTVTDSKASNSQLSRLTWVIRTLVTTLFTITLVAMSYKSLRWALS